MKDHSTVIVSINVGKEEASEVRKEEKKRYERLGKKKKARKRGRLRGECEIRR